MQNLSYLRNNTGILASKIVLLHVPHIGALESRDTRLDSFLAAPASWSSFIARQIAKSPKSEIGLLLQ